MKNLLSIALMATLGLMLGCEQSTTVKGPGDSKLTLVRPDNVTIERGKTVQLTVKIARANLDGPVAVAFNLPAGVTTEDASKVITGSEAIYTLKAAANADVVSNFQAKVTASGPNQIAATETFTVTIKAEMAGKLTLDGPSSVTVKRGKTATVELSIVRENLTGPVAISFSKLPAGVSVVETDKITGDKGKYTLKATDAADIVSGQEAQVTATGGNGFAVSRPLTIKVEAN